MQPESQSRPQQPVGRGGPLRRVASGRFVRLARRSLPGVLAGGAALVLLAGSQGGFALDQGPAAANTPAHSDLGSGPTVSGVPTGTPAYGSRPSAQPVSAAIDGGSPPLGGGSVPPATATAPSDSGTPQSPTPPVPSGVRIPQTVYTAYLDAEQRLAHTEPGCHLSWPLLAGIGQVESGQADAGNVTTDGTVRSPILGPPLNGRGFAAIRAADGGWARAEGPMQFIPSTWAVWGVDGNGDGKADPQNVFDSTLAAADYLCANGRDLSNSADLDQAILGYNGTQAYLAEVLAWMAYFQHLGAQPVPDAIGPTAASPRPPHDPAAPDKSVSPSATPTRSPTPTKSPTASPSRTASSPTPTGQGSSPSSRPSASRSASPSPSASPSESPSESPSPSPTCSPASPTATPSSTPTPTDSPTPTTTPTTTPTSTETPSESPTPTETPTPTASPTAECQ